MDSQIVSSSSLICNKEDIVHSTFLLVFFITSYSGHGMIIQGHLGAV